MKTKVFLFLTFALCMLVSLIMPAVNAEDGEGDAAADGAAEAKEEATTAGAAIISSNFGAHLCTMLPLMAYFFRCYHA